MAQDALRDWRQADLSPKLKAMLAFLEQLCLTPESIDKASIATLRAAGISTAGIREAVYVCALFSTITRIADALEWAIPPNFGQSVDALTKFGYKLPPFL